MSGGITSGAQMAGYLNNMNETFLDNQTFGNNTGQDLLDDLPFDNDLIQSRYDFTQRKFPSNLGEQSYNGHYMVINVNVQNGTRFGDSVDNGNSRINTFQKLPNSLSKVDSLRFFIDKEWKDAAGDTFDISSNLLVPRQTRRIVESIALYMPNTVVFDTTNDYEDVGLTSIGTSILQSASGFAAGFVGGVAKNGKVADVIDRASQQIGGAISTGSKFAQRPINPRIEVLFRNTLQRTFQFDFLFAPSNIEETRAMKQIIKTLRFHAAPEYMNNTGAFMYIPPSEFDLTFYHRGVENTNIPRINTCACTKINVDMAPQGVYSTFRNGAPVSCRMQVEFRELEVVNKLRVLQGF